MPSKSPSKSFFGYSTESNRLLSIDDVSSGLACGCVCPACRLPLIARKGEVTLWHFAHAPDREGKARAQCGLTLASSLRAMALQVFSDGGSLYVPAITGSDSLRSVRSGVLTETHVVSDERTLSLPPAEPGARWGDVRFDMTWRLDDYTLHVFLESKSHRAPASNSFAGSHTTGALMIDLSEVLNATVNPKVSIARALADDAAPRRWLYHPNLARAERRAHAMLMARVRDGIEARYDAHCLTCNTRWSGNGGVRCPECNEYRRKRIACE